MGRANATHPRCLSRFSERQSKPSTQHNRRVAAIFICHGVALATCNGFRAELAPPAPPTQQHQQAQRNNRRTNYVYELPACLLPQAQTLNHVEVAAVILMIQITQQTRAPTDQLQQTSARRKILLVRLEVLGQFHDAAGQQCHLNLRRTGVLIMGAIGRQCFLLRFSVQWINSVAWALISHPSTIALPKCRPLIKANRNASIHRCQELHSGRSKA